MAGDGARFDRYEILDTLGKGGMGIVYRAWDPEREREVALKLLTGEASESAIARFGREVSAIGRLDHPNIIAIWDHGSAPGPDGRPRPFYTMPIVSGKGLDEIIETADRERLLDLLEEAADAVAHAHDQGVVHRDLKPANILVDGDRPLVSDFGLAKMADEDQSLTRTGSMLGTPVYMAPEQFQDAKRAGAEADVYALGVILYEILAGHIPYPDANTPIALHKSRESGPPSRPSLKREGIDPAVEAVCLRAMDFSLVRRYPDAGRFLQALRDARAGRGTGSSWSPVRLAGVGLFLLLLLVGGALVASGVIGSGEAGDTAEARQDDPPEAPAEEEPDRPVPYGRRALVTEVRELLDQGRDGREKALTRIEEAQKDAAKDPVPHLLLGELHLRRLDLEAARSAVQAAVSRDPFFLEGHLFRGWLQELSLDFGPARKTYRAVWDEAVRLERPDMGARAALALARWHRAHGSAASAVGPVERAMKTFPEKSAELGLHLGDLHRHLQQVETAVDLYRTALETAEGTLRIRLRARIAVAEHRWDEANEALLTLVDVEPLWAWGTLGRIRARRGQPGAGDAYDAARRAERNPRTRLGQIGRLAKRILFRETRIEDATEIKRGERYVRWAAGLSPFASWVFDTAAHYFWHHPDHETCRRYALDGLDRNPRASACAFYLGCYYYLRRETYDPARAAEFLETSVEGDPDNPWHMNLLGSVYLRLGKPEKALRVFDRALEEKPDFTPARQNREKALKMLGRK